MVKTVGLFGFSRRLWQLMFSVGVWEMTFGSLLRTHAKHIRDARAQKADGQEINEIYQDKEGEAQLDIDQGEDDGKRPKWEPEQVSLCYPVHCLCAEVSPYQPTLPHGIPPDGIKQDPIQQESRTIDDGGRMLLCWARDILREQCGDKGKKGDAHEEESVDEQQRVIDLLDMPEHIVMVGPKNGDDQETRDIA